MSDIYPTVLSGGSGTRLWPLSRSMFPKQFIRFLDNAEPSFLAATVDRLPRSEGFNAPILLCNNDHRFLVRDELLRAGVEPKAIILEPMARNTAAAIAVAALHVLRENPAGILVVMPSDHLIRNAGSFIEAVRQAAKVAASGKLVLFGIKPDSAHTGYGYIRRGEPIEGSAGNAFRVASFHEKPDAATAARFLEQGGYFWNSGIFVLGAEKFIEELGRHGKPILEAARAALQRAEDDLGFLRLDREAFALSPSVSVDYAVMEKTTEAAMLPVDLGWNDIGSWASLWEVAPRDADGNFIRGDAIVEDVRNCFIHSERSFVSAIGVEDLVIVDTPDALLVADKARSQDVSKIVAQLKQTKRKEHEQHLRNFRPWGYFETLSNGSRFQVKLLHVKPGGKLSMQMHHHRSEHWIVVHGTARVTIGDVEKLVRENESVYIFATQWHRLENPGKVPLEIIEVQIGSYLGEDDIHRADDVYRRTPDETR